MKSFVATSQPIFTSNLALVNGKKLSSYVLYFTVIIASLFSTSALATYQYTYTGNPFTTTFNSLFLLPDPPYVYTTTEYKEEYISVIFTSQSLLSSGSNINDISGFTISVVTDHDRVLPYPYPYPSPIPDGVTTGSPEHPNYDGIFDIFAVDANGLPTDWNISVDYNYRPPTARLTQTFIKTSTTQDSTYGGYEGFYDYLGQLNNNPGTWSVTAVPEPETYAMMLGGLGLIGVAIHRRKISSRQTN